MVKIHNKEMSLSYSIQIPIMYLPILSEGLIPLGERMSYVHFPWNIMYGTIYHSKDVVSHALFFFLSHTRNLISIMT
jgi:hypothetical protein